MKDRKVNWQQLVAAIITDIFSVAIFVVGCTWFLTPAVFSMEWTKYVAMYCWIGGTMDHILCTQRNDKGEKGKWDLDTTLGHALDRFQNWILMLIFYYI